MKIKALCLLSSLTAFASCQGQERDINNIASITSSQSIKGDTVSFIDGEIRGIMQDTDNNIWLASNGNGVYKYDGKVLLNYTVKHGLSSNDVWMVKQGKNGIIYFKTNIRAIDKIAICSLNTNEFRTLEADTSIIDYDFKNGELIFDYYYDGTRLYKIMLPKTSPISNELNKRHHYDIYASFLQENGTAWFGTASAGICKNEGNTFTWFDNQELGSAIRDIYEDSKGRLWAGNNGDGLFRYDGKNFINFSREQNVHNPDFNKYPIGKPGLMSRVWKITEDKQGNLWVATIDNGVWMYDGSKLINRTAKDGLSADGVGIWTIITTADGKVWIGTEGDGVYIFDGKKFEKFKP